MRELADLHPKMTIHKQGFDHLDACSIPSELLTIVFLQNQGLNELVVRYEKLNPMLQTRDIPICQAWIEY